jgi:hypothetical protein
VPLIMPGSHREELFDADDPVAPQQKIKIHADRSLQPIRSGTKEIL